jgi:hypothetical protein
MSSTQHSVAERLAKMTSDERENALRNGYLTIDVDPARRRSESGVWTPVDLDQEIIDAAERISRDRQPK